MTYWLRLIAHTLSNFKPETRKLWKEAQELNLNISSNYSKFPKEIIGHWGLGFD